MQRMRRAAFLGLATLACVEALACTRSAERGVDAQAQGAGADAQAQGAGAGADAQAQGAGLDAQAQGADAHTQAAIDAGAIPNLKLPASYDPSVPAPLLVALPGYGVTAAKQEQYWRLGDVASERGFLYATPEPPKDKRQIPYWNATDACCDFYGAKTDDVARIVRLIDDVARRHRVDPKRIYLIGHSNGGFLAHRIACEQASRIAAIVSLAGAAWKDSARCTASEPVAILEAHGTNDDVVKIDGGRVFDRAWMAPYPSLRETLATWAKIDGCAGPLRATGSTMDLDARVAGAETAVLEIDGCARGGAVVSWSMKGSFHVPKLTAEWAHAVFDFLAAHPKS
jgi:polyhydroxybutyrate depolymerase